MKKFKIRNMGVLLLVFTLLFTNINLSFAQVGEETLRAVVEDSSKYIYETVNNPQVGSIGGEWAVIGLARSGYDVPKAYYDKYYREVESYVKSRNGKLHDVKYSEYSRVILALSAIGKDPRNVGGYDLTKALGDYDKTIYQGLNGPIWALIALDSKDYPVAKNEDAKTQATREMYVDKIMESQLSDGGWSLFGGSRAEDTNDKSDPDITGMALQALAKYLDRDDVKKATEEAIEFLSNLQNENGGYSSWGSENSESCAQVIMGLVEMGVSLDDSRFVKNGNGLLDNLLSFHRNSGGFLHTESGEGSSQMASEQGFNAVVSALRVSEGKSSIYRMADINSAKKVEEKSSGVLTGKNKDIKIMPLVNKDIKFIDIDGANLHKNKAAIESLAGRNIINGKSENEFKPNDNITRAEFATIVVKALGLDLVDDIVFEDVNSNSWFGKYVATANKYGIVNGRTKGKFEPNGKITKQEAASMVERAGRLAGIELELDKAMTRDILSQFDDYVTISQWAMPALAFCYSENILDSDDIKVEPKKDITRGEIAQMLFNMLGKAELLK